jgi:hypothetical protein
MWVISCARTVREVDWLVYTVEEVDLDRLEKHITYGGVRRPYSRHGVSTVCIILPSDFYLT